MSPSTVRRRLRSAGWLVAVTAGFLALMLPASAATQPASEKPAKGKQPALAAGQLVVKLAPGVSVDAVNRRLGSTTASVLLASHSIYMLSLPVQTSKKWDDQAKQVVDTLKHGDGVLWAEPNSLADAADQRFHYWPSGGPSCLGTDATPYLDQPALQQLSLSADLKARVDGKGVTVAVLDTGVDATHPALRDHLATGGYDYVDDDGEPNERQLPVDNDQDGRINEGYGHGTFVSGLVALVAPGAKILPMRVLDPEGRGNLFVVAEAIYDAVNRGASVINMSFGTGARIDSKVLKDAIDYAWKGGAVVMAAAGNDGSTLQHYPASSNQVMSVAAVDSANTLAPFSDRGDWVDIAAPGVDVVSTLPCGYGRWSGTSMAAPFVSGAAALVDQVAPRSKPADVYKRLGDRSTRLKRNDIHTGVLNISRSLSLP